MRIVLLSLVTVIIVATTANADINVWWQLDSGDGVAMDQGQGKTLVIDSPSAAPNGSYYEYAISMWISTDGTDPIADGCRAYYNNIWRGQDLAMTMEGAPQDGLLNPLGWTGPSGWSAGTQNSGDSLIENYGRRDYLPADEVLIWQGNSPLKVINMTLRVARDHFEATERHQVWQSVGASFYAWIPALPLERNTVAFGANPRVYGYTKVATFAEASDTELPVITIGIPEPATLGLLAFGMTMLLRRR